MLTLQSMATRVSNRINISSADFQSKIKLWIDERYEDLINRIEWDELIDTKEAGFVQIATEAFIILPREVDEVISVTERSNDRTLAPTTLNRLWRTAATQMDDAGKPIKFAPAGTVQFNDQPSDAATMRISSTSTGDTTQTVRLEYLVNGVKTSESLDLNGTTLVTSVGTCDANGFISASKSGTTAGNILIEGGTTFTDLVTLAPLEETIFFRRYRLFHVPDSGDTLSISFYKKRKQLVNDTDTPDFSCSSALIIGAYSDALFEQKQHQRGVLQEQRFEGMVGRLIDKSRVQGEQFEQATPHIEAGQRGLNIGQGSFRNQFGD